MTYLKKYTRKCILNGKWAVCTAGAVGTEVAFENYLSTQTLLWLNRMAVSQAG